VLCEASTCALERERESELAQEWELPSELAQGSVSEAVWG